jgi:23S rRNA-/tRNA-specific pseudouridylate synthase
MVDKTYHAIVIGEIHEGGTIDTALAPDRSRGGLMRVDRHGKPSRTDYTPLEVFRGYTLVEARPHTGRTHQIRVHLASIGHPLAVDPRYGGSESLLLSHLKAGYRPKKGREERPLIGRLTLHARALSLVAFGGSQLELEAPYPKDFEVALTQLRKWRKRRSVR